jgi:hypothetical protein
MCDKHRTMRVKHVNGISIRNPVGTVNRSIEINLEGRSSLWSGDGLETVLEQTWSRPMALWLDLIHANRAITVSA